MFDIQMTWEEVLASEYKKPYYKELEEFLDTEYSENIIYPPRADIFKALEYTPYSEVKAVILGQDPYHEEGEAHGLAFSVPSGTKIPPSLANIYKELRSDLGEQADMQTETQTDPQLDVRTDKKQTMPRQGASKNTSVSDGNLIGWATQGVLLLNTVLTVKAGEPNSHKARGWETFTDRIIELLNEHKNPIVFILWGNNAKSKKALIKDPKHLVLTGAHPSPLSAYRGFFGGKYFSKTNQFLQENGIATIDWNKKENN